MRTKQDIEGPKKSARKRRSLILSALPEELDEGKSMSDLPTLTAWYKEHITEVEGTLVGVTSVWLPTKFPTYTFACEDFRFLVYDRDVRFVHLGDAITKMRQEMARPYVEISRRFRGYGRLVSLEEDKAVWDPFNEDCAFNIVL